MNRRDGKEQSTKQREESDRHCAEYVLLSSVCGLPILCVEEQRSISAPVTTCRRQEFSSTKNNFNRIGVSHHARSMKETEFSYYLLLNFGSRCAEASTIYESRGLF